MVSCCLCGHKLEAGGWDLVGAEKRYRYLFEKEFPEMEYILCGKKRDPTDPSKRTIVVKEGRAC